ncbi:uncharacterized protein LOC115213595 isoform X1 [Argonauta hians]
MKWFITACIYLPLFCRSQPVNDIVTKGKVGDDIVNRVADVLDSFHLKIDRNCLQNLAVLRSNNGVPFIPGKGGIWRVHSSQLTYGQTSCKIRLFDQCNICETLTGIDFSSINFDDLDKPLYSALAMIMYILSSNNYKEYCEQPNNINDKTSLKHQNASDAVLKYQIAEMSNKFCTDENIAAGRFYFPHPDPTKYIQCGTFYEMLCAPGTIWSQTRYACVEDDSVSKRIRVENAPCSAKDNPCTEENIDAGKLYFSHPNPSKFIQCTEFGTFYVMPCAPGTVWSQTYYTCITNSRNEINITNRKMPLRKNNPCTLENIKAGRFYFTHPDPKKFIQCSETGGYYEMPCAPGTVWSQIAYTCINNFIQCNSGLVTTTASSKSTLQFSSSRKWITRGDLS